MARPVGSCLAVICLVEGTVVLVAIATLGITSSIVVPLPIFLVSLPIILLFIFGKCNNCACHVQSSLFHFHSLLFHFPSTARICASWVAFSDLAPLDLHMSAAVGKYLAARGLKLADLSASAELVLLPNLDMVTYHNGWFQGPRSLEETLHRFARWKGFAFTAHQQVALGSLRRAVSAARKRSLFYTPSSSAPARDRARCAADNGIAPTRGS